MMLLSSIFGVPQKQSAPALRFFARDDRDAIRHDANIRVAFHPRGIPPVAGTVINISVGGAAIRIHDWTNMASAMWLSDLDQGDELGLTGLLDIPMSCWVVTFDDDVLRVHFAPDGAVRDLLRVVIGGLAAP